MGEVEINALSGVDFSVEKGELCIVVGPSGAGKTTLLNILGGMDSCTNGEILVDGEHVERYDRRQLALYRRNMVGFVFQFYNLVQNLTALENVELAAQICKNARPARQTLEEVASPPGSIISPPSSPAASSSGSPLPGLWPRTPSSCSATSPRALSITRRASRY